jgi:hypothetical protein
MLPPDCEHSPVRESGSHGQSPPVARNALAKIGWVGEARGGCFFEWFALQGVPTYRDTEARSPGGLLALWLWLGFPPKAARTTRAADSATQHLRGSKPGGSRCADSGLRLQGGRGQIVLFSRTCAAARLGFLARGWETKCLLRVGRVPDSAKPITHRPAGGTGTDSPFGC